MTEEELVMELTKNRDITREVKIDVGDRYLSIEKIVHVDNVTIIVVKEKE